jgi:hypothetical protein
MAVDPRWTENQEVSRAAFGSANELVPALERIIRTGNWREFEHPMHGLEHYETFGDYCRRFLELSPEAIEALLDRSQFKSAAIEVRRMLREEVQPAAPQSGGRPSNLSDTKVTAQQEAQDAQAIVARLKRDDPALAAQVVSGTITPNAAAIQAGIRHKYARVRTDDISRAVGVLLKCYTRDQLLAALETV